MQQKFKFKPIVNLAAIVMLVLSVTGCSLFNTSPPPENESATGDPAKTKETTAVYYDFEDVLIPMELEIIKDRTVVISTPGYTSGIITLKGRVDRRSLFNFFNSNMQKDNWTIVSQIKSPGTTIMVFQKINRTSVITIRDEPIKTYVEIGVAPKVTGQGSPLQSSSLLE